MGFLVTIPIQESTRVTSVEQNMLLEFLSLRNLQGIQMLCVRNLGRDHCVYFLYLTEGFKEGA